MYDLPTVFSMSKNAPVWHMLEQYEDFKIKVRL